MRFSMGALADWFQIATGELLTFDVPPDGYRRVRFDVMAEDFVSCRVISGDDFWPVGCGVGQFTVEFSTSESVSIAFFGEPEAIVMLRTRVQTQVVAESDEASFTTIEPRRVGPSDEVRRMMYLQQLNANRREQMLRDELASMRGQIAQASAPAPAPSPVIEDGVDDPQDQA